MDKPLHEEIVAKMLMFAEASEAKCLAADDLIEALNRSDFKPHRQLAAVLRQQTDETRTTIRLLMEKFGKPPQRD
jgi:hypothetical protein